MDRELVLRLAKEEGLSGAEIGRRTGYTAAAVRKALRDLGVRLRPERRRDEEPHGERLYGLWNSLRARCENPKHPGYRRYGAKGYTVAPEWQTFWPFYDWAIAAGYQPLRTLEIRGRSKRFSPRTCRWITARERMQRDGFPGGGSPKRLYEAFGERKSVSAWTEDSRCAVTADTLHARLRRGVPPEQAITLAPGSRLPKDLRRERPRTGPRKLFDWDSIVRLHVEQGLSAREIADHVGGNWYSIRKGLIARGTWRPREKRPHGLRLRRVWTDMRSRCEDPSFRDYRRYGARGARVCAEWREFRAFYAWAMKSGYRPGLCLTRRKGTRVFSPRNCYWAEVAETLRKADRRAIAHPPRWTFEAFGERKGPAAWSRDPRCKVVVNTLIARIRGGWDPEAALTTPTNRKGPARAPRGDRLVTAFGFTKSITDWTRDRICAVTRTTLARRLDNGVPPEAAIRTPPYRLPPPSGGGAPVQEPRRRSTPSRST